MTRCTPRLRVAVGLLAAVAAVAIFAPVEIPTAAAQDIPVTVTVEPTTGLADADIVTITIRSTPDYEITDASTRLCRAGVDYQPSTSFKPNVDFEVGGANCPSIPVSTSAQVTVDVPSQGLLRQATPEGASYTFQVGTGTTSWEAFDGNGSHTLTCDDSNPCALVTEVKRGNPEVWTPFVQILDFGAVDPIAGCGGPADGVVATVGSDRMSDAYVTWTLDDCERSEDVGARSRAVFAGEAEAVRSFSTGASDVAYTGVGYHGPAQLGPEDGQRAMVPVPVAVNAAVVAVAGGQVLTTGEKVPYTDIRLSNEELAAMVAGGQIAVQEGGHSTTIQARNPELKQVFIGDNSPPPRVAAAAETSTVAFLITRFLDQLEGDTFVVPQHANFGESAGRARDASSSFALADPPYTNAIETFSGRPPFKRALSLPNVTSPQVSGPVWVLTDLATARAFRLTIVAIETAEGEEIRPTPESMQAALDQMQPDAEGFLVPDPGMTAEGDGPTPYPLTYVEYAMAPAEPLHATSTCFLRPDSQAVLGEWLEYITGPGQENLPAGMLPLAGDLASQASDAIGDVGTSEVTGTCAGRTQLPPTSSTTSTTSTTAPQVTATTAAAAGPPTTAARRSSGGSPSRATTTTLAAVTDATAPTGDGDDTELAIPAFSGASNISPLRAVVALLGIVAVTMLVTVATAGPGGRLGRRRGGGAPLPSDVPSDTDP